VSMVRNVVLKENEHANLCVRPDEVTSKRDLDVAQTPTPAKSISFCVLVGIVGVMLSHRWGRRNMASLAEAGFSDKSNYYSENRCLPSMFSIFLIAILICSLGEANGQTNSGRELYQTRSFAEILRSTNKEWHIFYIHGIGSDGPEDFDSSLLRSGICQALGDCLKSPGVLDDSSGIEYAEHGRFDPQHVPTLTYLGKPIWENKRQWQDSAPYVLHWILERRRNKPTIYVDEINWWPLMMALKCRQIVEADGTLIGPNSDYLDLCSGTPKTHKNTSTTHEQDLRIAGKIRLYPWIDPEKARTLKAMSDHGASFNRYLKNTLMDWGFSDALLGVGPLQHYLTEAIEELVVRSAHAPQTDMEFAFVTHSLGSYLVFSALSSLPTEANEAPWQDQFEQILRQTPRIFFLANQIRLLELANLGVHWKIEGGLQAWGDLRNNYLQSGNDIDDGPPQVMAFSSPSDLLTWQVPCLSSVAVTNVTVRTSSDWFGVFENPRSAHGNYARKKRVIKTILNQKFGLQSQRHYNDPCSDTAHRTPGE
jgi:hypothetical protein